VPGEPGARRYFFDEAFGSGRQTELLIRFRLLDSTLEEEGETDKKLTHLAHSVINIKAARK
jgi:hypothetical protein